ncbi:MAG: HD domain-containing phosphohydrolase [Acidobacteriota bacterium]
MKLRGQLVLSHLVLVLASAMVIGAVNLLVLLGSTRSLERQTLESAAESASHLLGERIAMLQHSRDELALFAANSGELHGDTETLGRLHDLLGHYGIERVEFFSGFRKEIEVYRWERGVGAHLATAWLPQSPGIAAQVAAGRSATWVQAARDEPASLKLCTAVPGSGEGERRWVVVTEPLDSGLLEHILPAKVIGGLENEGRLLAAWPAMPAGRDADLNQIAVFLPRGPFSSLFSPISLRRDTVQLDDGSALKLALLASPTPSGQSLLVGLRTWFLVAAGGIFVALALGSGLASRLLAPLRALLEGTAAMARGHLMVRLPTSRNDELGALMREFNRMADEIRNTYLGVISTLAEVVEAKSHYTRLHIEQVERLAMATADVLERRGWVRFSSHQRFVLSVAAILHDVGKIAIANEILNKSGPLETHEREQILSHPEMGALIVERIGKLERAAEIIRCAHEHFDGSGYPRGLKGEEIPLESRIILAVDAFDAMIMDRPYSNGRPLEAAIAELRSHAGHQFDPVVIEALVEVITVEQKQPGGAFSDSGMYRALAGEPTTPPPASRE